MNSLFPRSADIDTRNRADENDQLLMNLCWIIQSLVRKYANAIAKMRAVKRETSTADQMTNVKFFIFRDASNAFEAIQQ